MALLGIVTVVLGSVFTVLAVSISVKVAGDFLLGTALCAGGVVSVIWIARGRFWRQASKL